jgi:hypothetical protein
MTDRPLLFFTLVAKCPSCSRPFLVGIAEDDVRDLVASGTKPQQLSEALVDLHRSWRLKCADCSRSEAN